jgi:hypothetical protein
MIEARRTIATKTQNLGKRPYDAGNMLLSTITMGFVGTTRAQSEIIPS